MKSPSTYPLRLPRSAKAEVERRAKAEGSSINQFVATAVAEKLAAMNTAEFFAERRACLQKTTRVSSQRSERCGTPSTNFGSVRIRVAWFLHSGLFLPPGQCWKS
jgi:hypothetical protein